MALGDKADVAQRVQAIAQARIELFGQVYKRDAPDAHDQLIKERDAAQLGLKLLPDLQEGESKPQSGTDQIAYSCAGQDALAAADVS